MVDEKNTLVTFNAVSRIKCGLLLDHYNADVLTHRTHFEKRCHCILDVYIVTALCTCLTLVLTLVMHEVCSNLLISQRSEVNARVFFTSCLFEPCTLSHSLILLSFQQVFLYDFLS